MNNSNVMPSVRHRSHLQNVCQTQPQMDIGKIMLFGGSVPAPNARQSPSPEECPELRNMARKQKKPMMEKKRRARINKCFDHLKEQLLHSDMQQNSKLEKADILEKTVQFVDRLKQQNLIMLSLLDCTEPLNAFWGGVQRGISVSVMATVDLLSGLPAPFCSVELCHRVRKELPERAAMAASLSPTPAASTPTLTPNSATRHQHQQQPNIFVPSSKANALAPPSLARYVFAPVPSSAAPSPTAPFPIIRPPPLPLPPNYIFPFFNGQPINWPFDGIGSAGTAEQTQKCAENGPKREKDKGQKQSADTNHQSDQNAGTEDEEEEASDTGTPGPPGEEILVDVESVEAIETQKEGGIGEQQDSGVFSESPEVINRRKTKMAEEPTKVRVLMARKRRKLNDGRIWSVDSVLDRDKL